MRLQRRITLRFAVVFIAFATTVQAQALDNTTSPASDPWSNEVRAFAGKIGAAVEPAGTIALAVKNISDLDAAAAGAIERELRSKLAGAGFQVTGANSSETEVSVTLSQNVDGYLWIAEIQGQAGNQTAMLAVKSRRAVAEPARNAPILRQTPVLQQTEAILDFGETASADGSRMLVLLEPDRIAVLGGNGSGWALRDSAVISHAHPWPRDLRGHLDVAATGGFEAFLPGVHCEGSVSAALSLSCREDAEEKWKLGENSGLALVADRNYFASSTLRVGQPRIDAPIAYSMATTPGDGAGWIVTGADGNARLFEAREPGSFSLGHWGDDVASVEKSCGANWQVLTTGTGDWTQQDRLQAYEIAETSAIPAGQGLEFAGPIVALWSVDGNAVRAVWRNLETGMYEASIVSVSCGN